MGLPLRSRCDCVEEINVLANVARVGDPSGGSVLDDVWYALDEGLECCGVFYTESWCR